MIHNPGQIYIYYTSLQAGLLKTSMQLKHATLISIIVLSTKVALEAQVDIHHETTYCQSFKTGPSPGCIGKIPPPDIYTCASVMKTP